MRKANLLILLILLIVFRSYPQSNEVDSLKLILKTSKDTSRVNTLNKLAKAYNFIDYNQMFIYASESKELAVKLNYREGLALALSSIGGYYLNMGEDEKAISLFHQALSLTDSNDAFNRGKLYHNIGLREKNPTVKLNYLTKANHYAEKANNPRLGFYYHTTGNFYYEQGKYDESYSFFVRGLNAAQKNHEDMAMALNLDGMATILNTQNNDKALDLWLKALKIARKTSSKNIFAALKLNLADYYRGKGKLDTAFTYASQALEMAKALDYNRGIIKGLSLLGSITQLQNKNEKSLNYYTQALHILEKEEEGIQLAIVLLGTGSLYNSMGKYDEAIKYLSKGLEKSKHINNREFISRANLGLSEAYKALADYKKAYEFYKAYNIIEDSINNLETSGQIASINTKYEVDKKEQSIKLLQKNNRIKDLKIAQSKTEFIFIAGLCLLTFIITFLIYNRYRIKVKANNLMKKANSEILANVQEKEVLLQEIHHRVKNNLQLISSLLKWQGENVENEEMLKIIGDGRSRIKSMSLIHEALYQTNNLALLDLNTYLNNLLTYLDKVYNKNKIIVLKKAITPISLDVDIAIPIGLIVTELVSNCFKYAFPNGKGGEIEISFDEDEPNLYTLVIRDNGIGLPNDILDDKNNQTMGIQLVKLLVKQVRGALEIYNKNGANFVISFSDINYKTHSLKSYGQYQNTNS